MAYQCPRCKGPVQRGSSQSASLAGGLVGALLASAFGALRCAKCGKIPRAEFPADVRSKIMINSILLVLVALLVLIGAIVLLVVLQK